MPLIESKEENQDVQDEIIGDIHQPILRRQLTQVKYFDLANRIENGELSIPAAIHQLNRYKKLMDEKIATPPQYKM